MEATLAKFEARFSDYTSLFSVADNERRRAKYQQHQFIIIEGPTPDEDPEPDYAEICTLTADYLYKLLEETFILKTKSISELLPYLQDQAVVYFEFLMETGESHALCFILEGDRVVVCQSLGGIYRACHEAFTRDRFVQILRSFYLDNDVLTHFGHFPVRSITKIKIARRKDLSPDLIPAITPQEETWLRKARAIYIEECWPEGDDPFPEEYILTRPADLYPFLLHLQRTYHA
jgi:hypothetical protein